MVITTTTLPAVRVLELLFPQGIPRESYAQVVALLAEGLQTELDEERETLEASQLPLSAPLALAPAPDGRPQFLTPAEAAEALGISPGTVYGWVKAKKLKPVSGGGAKGDGMRFARKDIEDRRSA